MAPEVRRLLAAPADLALRVPSLPGGEVPVRCTEHGKVVPHYRCDESERWLDAMNPDALCRSRTGVIWKLDGEVCSCIRTAGHDEENHAAGDWHVCSCNAWFDDSCVQWRPGDDAQKGAA